MLAKERSGDRRVAVTAPDLAAVSSRSAVVVDDIASSGATLIEAARTLRRAGLPPRACAVVHALCSSRVTRRLQAMGARLVSIDTVAHATNAISCTALLASETRQLL
jgi:ribose-phosphate pyrophosphokinase